MTLNSSYIHLAAPPFPISWNAAVPSICLETSIRTAAVWANSI